ncbi:type VI secretion system tip protein VgrG [Paraburkholderia sp. NMBU_R16]|uniref:type VI secretion system Vgr family protein n=1 Tax=Paraburkholderia sp. NMBU_R16 TaxID=2698676 RepID=UPI001567B373|nr:type VI secretion system tip protein TssI/VgrG [Paraburkholderia sp. NMBU_R16]NRO94454.1 type VI secretion system tip protein VgrG [Paraburkholderia sp. NMBU_R16]
MEIELKSSVGGDTLRLVRMRGSEALATPFEFELELASDAADIGTHDLVGTTLSLAMEAVGGMREFNGIVARVGLVDYGMDESGTHRVGYQATVRPRLWLLTRGAHCRFFHDLSVPEIVGQLLDDYSVDYENRCTASYPKLAHCAQYRETDFDFFSRLLEREGIYYYFEHRGGKDILVLADAPSAHEPMANYGTISFQPWVTAGQPMTESVYRWSFEEELLAGTSEVNAFDFRKARSSENQGLLARASSKEGRSAYVLADYSPGYAAQSDGHRYAQTLVEAHQAQAVRAVGRASARGVHPGGTFSLTGYPRADQNAEYLVVAAEYELGAIDALASMPGAASSEPLFDCEFVAIRKSRPYRPQRRTPRPHTGLQTAIVVTPEGDQTAASAYLQVKVQFHWEQFNPPKDGERMQRCWVRVAQGWAGKAWGAMFVPRVGQEVVVAFLDGDPDHPLIVGSVYNSTNETPYQLPANSGVSTIRTKAIEGSERNEVRFNDKDLQLLLYTGGRHDTYVKKDDLTWVGGSQHTIVRGKQLVKVGAQHLSVIGSQNVKVDGSASLQAEANVVQKAGMTYAASAELVSISGGATVCIEARALLTLKVGESFVAISPAGVQISGPIVGLNSGGSAGSGANASPESPSAPDEADDGSSVK